MKNQKELKNCFRTILVNMLIKLDIISNSDNEKKRDKEILEKTINLLLKNVKSLLT